MKTSDWQNTQYINSLATDTKNGSTEAFVLLLGIFSPTICAIAHSFSLPNAEYDDLCQEGRIALFRAAQNFDDLRASFKTFAGKCIKNSMCTWAKKYSDSVKNKDCHQEQDEIIDSSFEVSQEVFSTELLDGIIKSKNFDLSDYERKCIGLKIAGLSAKETAALLNKDEKSIENTLFRARAKLKKYISM